MTTAPIEIDTSGIDLADPQFATIEAWSGGSATRSAYFKKLRDDAPVMFAEEAAIEGFPQGPGFWSVTRFDDITIRTASERLAESLP